MLRLSRSPMDKCFLIRRLQSVIWITSLNDYVVVGFMRRAFGDLNSSVEAHHISTLYYLGYHFCRKRLWRVGGLTPSAYSFRIPHQARRERHLRELRRSRATRRQRATSASTSPSATTVGLTFPHISPLRGNSFIPLRARSPKP